MLDPTSNTHVLVAEKSATGHHLQYVKFLVDRCNERGIRATVLCPESVKTSSEFSTHLATQEGEAVVEIADEAARNTRTWVNVVVSAADQLRVDHVIVPDGDRFAAWLSVRIVPLRVPVTTLLMRSPFMLPPRPSIRGRGVQALKVASLGLAKAHSQLRVVHLAGPGSLVAKGIELVGDPVEVNASPAAWPEGTGLTDSDLARTWFGVFGNIDQRKNVPLILDALTESTFGSWGLVLAGRVAPEVKKDVERRSRAVTASGGLVLAPNRVLSEDEFWGLLRGVDCIVVAHCTAGSSGVLLRAAAAGSRVVVAGSVSLMRHRRALGVGLEADLSIRGLSRAFEVAVLQAKPDPFPVTTPSEFADDLLQMQCAVPDSDNHVANDRSI